MVERKLLIDHVTERNAFNRGAWTAKYYGGRQYSDMRNADQLRWYREIQFRTSRLRQALWSVYMAKVHAERSRKVLPFTGKRRG